MRLTRQTKLLKTGCALALAGAGVLLGSCSTAMLLSEKTDGPGLIYYLPKTIVTLEIGAYGFLTVRDGAPIDDTTGAPKDLRDIQENYRVIRLNAQGAKPTAQAPSPVGTIVRTIADQSRGYSLQYDSSILSLDRVCMGVSPQGMLQSVEGAADDKTSDIVVSLAKVAGRLLGQSAFASITDIRASDSDAQALRTITVDIDPLNRVHWDQVNRAMRQAFGPIANDYRFSIENIEDFVTDAKAPSPCPVNSVCYRTTSPARFVLGTSKGATSSMYLPVINRKVTGHIDVSRAMMVEKITRLSFKDGVLAGVSIRKPSEGLALAKLPLTVLDAVATSALAAPGNFVSKVSGGQTVSDLITTSKNNATQIAALQTSLQQIRESDLSKDSTPAVLAAEGQQIQCKGTVDP